MVWKKVYQSIYFHLNRLYKWKWGYAVSSLAIALLVLLLGLLEGQQSFWDVLFTAFVYGSFLTGIAFLIRKYGWEGFATKTIEVTVKILLAVGTILIAPLRIIWDLLVGKPWRFIFDRIPKTLPTVIRPLYRFCWSLFFAFVVYFAVWILFSFEPQPKHFVDVEILGSTYHLVIAGLEFAGLILGFALLDFIPSYLGMFWNWLGKFKWNIRFIFYR